MKSNTSLQVLNVALGAMSAAWILCAPAHAQAGADAGHWIVDTRLRYETVSQDGSSDADALMVRARAGYETRVLHGFRGLVEVEGVGHLNEDFNDTVNGRTAFATVPDPETVELNRLQLTWAGGEGRKATIGRQRIILNNARFIGNAGFRMNEQTFDAVRLEARPLPHLNLTYIYLDRVRRTLGDESRVGEWESNSHVVQADLDGAYGKLSAYALLLDFNNASAQSSQTYGARWQDDWTFGPNNVRLTLEAATQSDYGNAPSQFNLGYQLGEIGFRHGQITATLGGERLEGNGARGFSTPLATLHAFQGWADVFVNTPPDGIRDLYVGASYNTRPWPAAQPVALTLMAHSFTDDSGGADFGNELNVSARFTLNSHMALELAAASFDGSDPRFADRTKAWVTLESRL